MRTNESDGIGVGGTTAVQSTGRIVTPGPGENARPVAAAEWPAGSVARAARGPAARPPVRSGDSPSARLDYLDATRAFALILGVVFHACLSFVPTYIGWAVQDVSTSPLVLKFFTITHSFRMETFFLLAGFFGCVTLRRSGPGGFVRGRALRVGVPFIAGWFLLRPLLMSGWIMGGASMRGDWHFWPSLVEGFKTLRTLPTGIFTGSHLWFLYYLAMITTLTLVARALLARTGPAGETFLRRADVAVAWFARSGWGVAVGVAPTALAMGFMRFWAVDTPDQSLTPDGPVLAIYGGFFVLGWMFGRQRDSLEAFARLTPARWLGAVLGIAATLWLEPFQGDPGHPHFTAAHVGFLAAYATMMWSLVALTIGLFRRFFSKPSAVVRYVADSSYWMYLVHLPIVIWLQVAVAEVALPWPVKLAFVSGAAILISLLSYDLAVRPTVIGAILNGRRRESALVSRFGRRQGASL